MSKPTLELPKRKLRTFLPDQFNVDNWENLEPFFKDLQLRELNSKQDLEKWLSDRSELEAVLSEDLGWRYIRMSVETQNEEYVNAYKNFVTEIQPKIAPFSNDFNKKLIDSPYRIELDSSTYAVHLRGIQRELELFREENIPLFSELSTKSQEFGTISSQQSIEYKGEKLTLQQAWKFMQSSDRAERETVYRLISNRRLEDVDSLDKLFSELIQKRHQVALNAGYKNFRDYKHDSLGRFDYTPEDCINFHSSIEKEIVPLVKQIHEERKSELGFDSLRPWDMEIDPTGAAPLRPFENSKELITNSIECLSELDPYFGECIAIMNEMGHLDLDSKDGKSPGGYNYPLYEIGVPFIFMNSVGTQNDLVTMVHEAGHAIHSFLTRDLKNTSFKSCPSEVAELASMSMELISMDYWAKFYPNRSDLKRAYKDQLARLLTILPWVATIDHFQQWLYTNPDHSFEQRENAWLEISAKYSTGVVDHSGFEEAEASRWQKQLHLFEVPFYYIEYAISQLGAIAVWRNYKTDSKKAIEQYKAALQLGYMKPIGEIYETAGIEFNFSAEYIKELADFVKSELNSID